MEFDEIPSGPVGHIGIAFVLSIVLRLNVFVTTLCAILPDLVDKPMDIFLETGGRYIGHTLLFVFLVTAVFFLWRRRYGWAALVGGLSHLVIDRFDSTGFVPWFFPFRNYDFSSYSFNWSNFYERYFSVSGLGEEIIWVVVIGVVALLSLWLYRWCSKRLKGSSSLNDNSKGR
ncbi:MAG: metal-dependent hydrolase [Planctomycetes bacterium]|nr:metal-dependent hydrolase [Planctomycetota bacterium]